MCETLSTHGSDVKWTLLVSKSEVKEQCGGLRCSFDDIIKGDLKETRCDIVKWAVFHHLFWTLSAVECQLKVKSTKLICTPPLHRQKYSHNYLSFLSAKSLCPCYYYYYYYYYLYYHLLSQTFSPSRYFSWTSGDPHRSGYKLHTAVLSVLCVMFQVQLSFVVNLSNVFLVQLPYYYYYYYYYYYWNICR